MSDRRQIISEAVSRYRQTERPRVLAFVNDKLEVRGLPALDGDEREEAVLALATGSEPYNVPSAPTGPAEADDDDAVVEAMLQQRRCCTDCEAPTWRGAQ